MEPNLANPEDVERFINGLAKLFIEEYKDDLPINDPGFFSEMGRVTASTTQVENDFMENWKEYLPSEVKISCLQHRTIGLCGHIQPLIIMYDDVFQKRVCKKIGEIFRQYVLDGKDLEEMDVNDTAPPALHLTMKCQIHNGSPPLPKFTQFIKEFTEKMFGNFLRGVSFQQKKLLYKAAEIDRNATMGDDYHHLCDELQPLWSYLVPTLFQCRALMYNIYGFKYHLLERYIVPKDRLFRHRVRQELSQKIRSYLIQHGNVFGESR